jgi:hypothetical protein
MTIHSVYHTRLRERYRDDLFPRARERDLPTLVALPVQPVSLSWRGPAYCGHHSYAPRSAQQEQADRDSRNTWIGGIALITLAGVGAYFWKEANRAYRSGQDRCMVQEVLRADRAHPLHRIAQRDLQILTEQYTRAMRHFKMALAFGVSAAALCIGGITSSPLLVTMATVGFIASGMISAILIVNHWDDPMPSLDSDMLEYLRGAQSGTPLSM